MSLYRVAARSCAAFTVFSMAVFVLTLFSVAKISATPAEAQGLTRYGMWGNNIKRRRSSAPKKYKFAPGNQFANPQQLGGNPGVARSVIAKQKRRKPRKPIALAEGGARPVIKPRKPQMVTFNSDLYQPGDVVIDTKRRKLFLLLANSGYALVYPIAVGKRGYTWTGVEKVTHVQDWPDWYPPEEMRERSPRLPLKMTGGIKNPLGAKAIYLGKTLYRIHGTNARWTIGRASSSGCFRMHNAHVVHLAKLIDKSTTVHVLDRLPRGVVAEQKKKTWKKKKRSRKKRRRSRRRANSV